MATIPSQKNVSELVANLRSKIAERTNLTNIDQDSKAGAIIDSFANEFVKQSFDYKQSVEDNSLSSAQGNALLRLGTSRGLDKNLGTFSSSSSTARNVCFYVSTGTFGSINSGGDITIPANSEIFSVPNNNELGARVVYKTTEDNILLAASSVHYVSVVATTIGNVANVGAGVLVEHNFTDYTDSANSSLKVINFYPILNGETEDDDDRYRFYVSQQYKRLHQTNDMRLFLTSIRVPGVLNIEPISGYYGIGTVGVVVYGADNQSSAELVEKVQTQLNRYASPGFVLTALPAICTGLHLNLELSISKSLTINEQNAIKSNLKTVVLKYLRNVPLGGTLSFSDLEQVIKKQNKNILSANSNTKSVYKNIYITRGYSNSSQDDKAKVITDFLTLERDEYVDLIDLDVRFI